MEKHSITSLFIVDEPARAGRSASSTCTTCCARKSREPYGAAAVRRFWPYLLTFAAIAAIVVGFFYRSGRQARIGDIFDVPKLGEEALPELLQRIRDFHRVVTRKGEKILEISAQEASYFRDSSAVEIKAPSLVFFHQGERVGSIDGRSGAGS